MKRYLVELEAEEREVLAAVTRKGSHRSQKVVPSQGGWRVRGAPRRAQLRRSARGAREVVAAASGGQGGGAGVHRRRVARDGAAGAKKNSIKPWRRVGWVIPPQRNADFAAGMERVLDIYRRPYDADFPVVCMDETPRQLIGETRTPVPAAPGRPAREDYEYRRLGSLRVRLHSQARQLAERRRGRTQRLDPPVPQSPHRRPARRGRRLAGGQRPDPSQGRLAVHHGQRTGQAQAPLSDV